MCRQGQRKARSLQDGSPLPSVSATRSSWTQLHQFVNYCYHTLTRQEDFKWMSNAWTLHRTVQCSRPRTYGVASSLLQHPDSWCQLNHSRCLAPREVPCRPQAKDCHRGKRMLQIESPMQGHLHFSQMRVASIARSLKSASVLFQTSNLRLWLPPH